MKKATAIAPANIAFIKYWGTKDEVLRLPTNASLSMNLSNLLTTTTVEFSPLFKTDLVIINGKKEELKNNRALKHIQRIKKLAQIKAKVKIVSNNNFPTGTGLSSSSSGFAALTLAGITAAGLQLSEKELSILARLASGSACRSVPDGFVEWFDANTHDTSYAVSLYPPNYWELVDVVAVMSTDKKEVSSSAGHKLAATSPFFATRLEFIEQKTKKIKAALQKKNFKLFGEILEAEALELHAIYITSYPSLIYLLPETVRMMHAVKKWREQGVPVYFTLNTGQDIHLICEKKNAKKVARLAEKVAGVKNTIVNHPAEGARLVSKHLF